MKLLKGTILSFINNPFLVTVNDSVKLIEFGGILIDGQLIKKVGKFCCLQGNLDPSVLLGSKNHIEEEAKSVIEKFKLNGFSTGHIFNLGHGISQFTPPENVECLVETVKKFSSRSL